MTHLPEFIKDLALILSAAALITLLCRLLKQPVVLGYIIAGFLVGPNFKLTPVVVETESIKTWADIGVIFLLFGLGLEFSFKKLLKIGGVSALTAIIEVTLTLLLGFFTGHFLLGWNTIDSLFFGGILSIASTTIIVRAFDELGVKSQKFATIVTGVLVIEDLVAVLLMVLLSTVAVSHSFGGVEMLKAVAKLVFFLVLWFVSGIFFIPTFFRSVKKWLNDETLFVISLAFCFLMVVLATYTGFSPALGAFIMGSILAETTKAEKIEQLTKSVKSLFGAIFFVSVGMLIDPQMIIKYIIPIGAATLVLLIGKPIFVTSGVLLSGQPLNIAIRSGMTLSQIGEFSFIIASLGLSLNVTSNFLYPVAVAVSVLTTFTTPYMIKSSLPVCNSIDSLIPQKWKKAISNYSIDAQTITEINDWKLVIKSYFVNVIIFSVIIIALILISTRFAAPLLIEYGWNKLYIAVISLIVLAPFLWALAFRKTQRQAFAHVWLTTRHRGPIIMLESSRVFIAVFYIGFLFHSLYSPLIAFAGVICTCIILLLFSGKITRFYGKIEARFFENFNERERNSRHTSELLTPWDTHITKFELNAFSPFIGKTLQESRIREEFGVNIVLIERGDYSINVPTRDQCLYPDDVISVIGTDDQLLNFKKHIDLSSSKDSVKDSRQTISLRHFILGSHSPLIGKNIRESGIREKSHGLIIGIERDSERIINPESGFIFRAGDIIWIVGDDKRIQIIMRESSSLV